MAGITEDLQIAPLRKLDDFVLGKSAKFQLPDIKHLPSLNKRITSNLLYYQSNYFVLTVLLLIVIG